MNGIIIRIREKENIEKSKNKLIAMLELLFGKTEKEEKKRKLEEEHKLIMSRDLEGKVNEMCNWGEVLVERSIERGMEIGIEKGIESLVEVCKEFGESFHDTMERLMSKFSLDEEKAEEYLKKYW